MKAIAWLCLVGWWTPCLLAQQTGEPAKEEPAVAKEDLAAAERVLGLSFTEPERDLMLGELADQLEAYAVLHQRAIGNQVAASSISISRSL